MAREFAVFDFGGLERFRAQSNANSPTPVSASSASLPSTTTVANAAALSELAAAPRHPDYFPQMRGVPSVASTATPGRRIEQTRQLSRPSHAQNQKPIVQRGWRSLRIFLIFGGIGTPRAAC
jgi:hypothetical protein